MFHEQDELWLEATEIVGLVFFPSFSLLRWTQKMINRFSRRPLQYLVTKLGKGIKVQGNSVSINEEEDSHTKI